MIDSQQFDEVTASWFVSSYRAFHYLEKNDYSFLKALPFFCALSRVFNLKLEAPRLPDFADRFRDAQESFRKVMANLAGAMIIDAGSLARPNSDVTWDSSFLRALIDTAPTLQCTYYYLFSKCFADFYSRATHVCRQAGSVYPNGEV